MQANDTKKSDRIAGDLSGQSAKPWMKVANAVVKMQKIGAGMTNICTGCGG